MENTIETTTAKGNSALGIFHLQRECCVRLEGMNLPFPHYSRIDMLMTLEYAHDDCPIDFAALLAADDLNFTHDMVGLWRHVSRETLKIENCFRPRFAA